MPRHYVSLGSDCLVAHRLRQIQSKETYFFDWIETSFETVLQLLAIPTLDQVSQQLSTNIVFDKDLFEGHRIFTCKSFDRLRSLHDLPPNGHEPVIFNTHFLQKHVRRYERFLSLLSKEPDVTFIHFVHNIDTILMEQIHTFFKFLHNLHSNNNFKLIILYQYTQDETILNNNIRTIPSVTCENLRDYHIHPIPNTPRNWTLPHVNWDEIWKKCKIV